MMTRAAEPLWTVEGLLAFEAARTPDEWHVGRLAPWRPSRRRMSADPGEVWMGGIGPADWPGPD